MGIAIPLTVVKLSPNPGSMIWPGLSPCLQLVFAGTSIILSWNLHGGYMGIRTKGRRKITVHGRLYVWDIHLDCDSPYYLLDIASEDKCIVLSCPLGTEIPYVISKGKTFQKVGTAGIWKRYLLPFDIPEIITPGFVSDLILWATEGEGAMEGNWDGKGIPV